MAKNQYGQISSLNVELVYKNGRTCLDKAAFTAPFKVMKPFFVKRSGRELMQLMMITVSAGIMAGDVQDIRICIGEYVSAEIISQSFEKIHKMPAGEACRSTRLIVGRNSFCYYNPLPVIPFAGSAFTSETVINLADETSVLIYREILASGRIACKESFAYRSYKNKVAIWRGTALIYYDNIIFEPEQTDLQGFGMMEGYTHLGSMIICHPECTDDIIREIRVKMADRQICGGISRTDDGITVLRVLGMRADDIIRFMDYIYNTYDFTKPV